MEQQTFSDGIGRIYVAGGIVRLDLVTYSATETDAKGQPRPVLTHRLVMGVDAFLRSSEKILEAVQVITRAQAAAASQPPAGQPVPAQPAHSQPPTGTAPAEISPQEKTSPALSEAMPSPWTVPLTPRRPFP